MQVARRGQLMLVGIATVAALTIVAGLNASAAFSKSTVTITPAGAFPSSQLATNPGADWITNGGAVNNERYSTLNQITSANVSGLQQVFHIHLNSGKAAKYSAEATPLVYQGVMYMVTGNDDAYRTRRDDGPAALDVPVAHRPDDQHGVLRLGQPWSRAR